MSSPRVASTPRRRFSPFASTPRRVSSSSPVVAATTPRSGSSSRGHASGNLATASEWKGSTAASATAAVSESGGSSRTQGGGAQETPMYTTLHQTTRATPSSTSRPSKPSPQPLGDFAVLGLAKGESTKAKTLEQLPAFFKGKGFEVVLFAPDKDNLGKTFVVGLRVGPRLMVRTAMRMERGVKPETEYSVEDRTLVVGQLVEIVKKILKAGGWQYEEVILLHDDAALDSLVNATDNGPLARYAGTEIALYFEWLHYYTRMLAIPGLAGVALFAYQQFSGKEDSQWVPLFNILLAIWGTVLLEGWKRRNATKAFEWGVLDKEDQSAPETSSEEEQQYSALFTYGVSLPTNVAVVAALVQMMLHFIWLSDNAIKIYGADSYMQYMPLVLYSAVPPIAQSCYGLLVVFLNDREGHRSPEEYETSLQFKLFAFHFVNSFCSLFYIAFWLKDVERLQTMLMSLLLTKQVVGNLLELATPVVMQWMTEAKVAIKDPASYKQGKGTMGAGTIEGRVESVLKSVFIGVYAPIVRMATMRTRKSLDDEAAAMEKVESESAAFSIPNEEAYATIDAQRNAGPYEVAQEHIEILVQFGYVSMFAVAFPLAPILALLNNLWEARLDLLKLKVARRPAPRMVKTIGGWYTGLEFMGAVAVLTNCLLMVLISHELGPLVPPALRFLLDSTLGRFLLALVVEHFLMAGKVVLSAAIDDVPPDIRAALHKKRVAERDELFQSQRQLRLVSKQASSARESTTLAAIAAPEAPSVAPHPTPEEATRKQRNQTLAFSPLAFFPIMCLPYAVTYFNLPAVWVLPPTFLILSYLHNIKRRRDRATGLKLALDPVTLGALMKHLPAWFYESDVERSMWMSSVMQKMWAAVSGMTEKIVLSSVQPILDTYRPAIFNQLQIIKCRLGTVAPTVTGVRFVETQEDLVRLDVHIAWAGDPDVVLEVGYKGLPLVLELSEVQFRGKIRVELNPLMPDIPGFGAIAITFMEEPFMDFSFKIAKLDVMAMGAPDMSVADLVTDIIKENVLKGLLLYPAQLVIPMIDDIDLERLRNPAPIGILMLTVLSARGLRVADIRSSDAYVKIRYGLNQKFKTKVIFANLNPEWNEEFRLKIYAIDQPIVFTVKDYDLVGKDDDLGDYSLRIDDLVPLKPVDLDLALCHTTQGSIQVRLIYHPVSRFGADAEEDEVLDEEIAELEEDLAIASMWADEASDEEGEDGAGTAATKAMSSRSMNRIGGTQWGIMTVEGLSLDGYSSKGGFMGGSKVLLRLALGTRVVRTTPEKTPCRDPIFPDQFTFTIDDKLAGTCLDIAIVESQLLGAPKVLGTTSIDLSTFTRHHGKTEADWPIHMKGKAVNVHVRAYFSPLQSTGPSAVA